MMSQRQLDLERIVFLSVADVTARCLSRDGWKELDELRRRSGLTADFTVDFPNVVAVPYVPDPAFR